MKVQTAINRGHCRLQADVLRRAVAGEHDDFTVLFRWQLSLGFENVQSIAHTLRARRRACHRRVNPRRIERREWIGGEQGRAARGVNEDDVFAEGLVKES